MTLAGGCVPPILLAVTRVGAAPVPARAQLVLAETEALATSANEGFLNGRLFVSYRVN
jgi:hypothetical protein